MQFCSMDGLPNLLTRKIINVTKPRTLNNTKPTIKSITTNAMSPKINITIMLRKNINDNKNHMKPVVVQSVVLSFTIAQFSMLFDT